jgi:hypothetical protein
VDTLGNIFIYYILGYIPDGIGGDLQGFYFERGPGQDFTNPADWVQHLNIDGSADLVKWVVAPDSIPISADM